MKKLIIAFVFALFCSSSYAQNITVDLEDAPVRTTLEMMFKQAGIKNYVIDNSVSGFITMKLTDIEFENSLKIVMRNSFPPLTYTKENDVWIVKERKVTEYKQPAPIITVEEPRGIMFERIPLTFIDPVDLMSAFGFILNVGQFGRYGGMNGMGAGGNGGFGGVGGFGNGAMGGNGGLGLGAGNGAGGGAMGGIGGAFGGGMNGGMGGFGGGRNF
jgi:hypothetical protein